jgi:hypothetical protein
MTEKEKKEKAEVLEKILKGKSLVIRLVPGPGYSNKMRTVFTSSLDQT